VVSKMTPVCGFFLKAMCVLVTVPSPKPSICNLPNGQPLTAQFDDLFSVENLPWPMRWQILSRAAVYGLSNFAAGIIVPITLLTSLGPLPDQSPFKLGRGAHHEESGCLSIGIKSLRDGYESDGSGCGTNTRA
jgi:hypothetical protein